MHFFLAVSDLSMLIITKRYIHTAIILYTHCRMTCDATVHVLVTTIGTQATDVEGGGSGSTHHGAKGTDSRNKLVLLMVRLCSHFANIWLFQPVHSY